MKKIAVFVGMGLFIMEIVGTCQAASIGPMEPLGPMKVGIGAEYNGFGRDLGSNGSITSGEIKSSNQGYVELALGITDWANIYGKIGMANLEQKVNWNVSINQTIKYDYGFLWGVGSNALFNIGNNFGIGGDIQLNMWFSDADSISGSNNPTFVQKGSLKNYEFQTAAYLKYDYQVNADSKITPYLGGYYSYFRSNIDKTIEFQDGTYDYLLGDMEGKDSLGILAGLNIAASQNIYFKLEGRFIAETAGSIGVFYKY